MSEKDIKKDVSAKKEETKNTEAKRFNFNVDSGKDADGNPVLFTFSGPEKAPLGLIYDASHRIMMEIISFIQKRAEDLKPKTPESKTPGHASVIDAKKNDKKEKAKD